MNDLLNQIKLDLAQAGAQAEAQVEEKINSPVYRVATEIMNMERNNAWGGQQTNHHLKFIRDTIQNNLDELSRDETN